MAVELSKLIEKVKNMDIKLVAGKNGENNSVAWCHMVENTIAADFLNGGELVFITGIGIDEDNSIEKLIQKLYEKNAAGIIVNIGPYIDTVSESVIEFCNTKALPLYIVPWRIHLAEIMRIVSYSITREEHKELEISAAFKNAIYFPHEEELYIVPLSQNNYQSNWSYCVCVMRLLSANEVTTERMESFRNTLGMIIRHFAGNITLFDYESQLVIVFANMNEQQILETVGELRKRIKALILPGEELSFGLGKLTKSIRCLYKSFNHANAIIKLQGAKKIHAERYYYGQLGMYRLLIGIDDKEIVEDYYNNVLKELVVYDEKNNSDLQEVLRCYLENDGSVSKTADELFVHRNTINYKLNKIKEILGIDLSSLETRMELMMALALKEIL